VLIADGRNGTLLHDTNPAWQATRHVPTAAGNTDMPLRASRHIFQRRGHRPCHQLQRHHGAGHRPAHHSVRGGPAAPILIWNAIGGPGTLADPILGLLAIQFSQQYPSDRIDYWQLTLGLALIALIALVAAAPQGLAGIGRTTPRRIQPLPSRRKAQTP